MDASRDSGGPLEGNEHYYFQQRAHTAALSCARVAESESLMGYKESAQAYLDIAMEIREAGAWWMGQQTALERHKGMFVPAALKGVYGP